MDFLSTQGTGENIWIASSDGDVNRVTELLTSGEDVNGRDEYGYTPIHAATSYSHLALIELLIQAGADVNIRDLDGDTPLHICESPQVAEFLLANGADEHAVNAEGKSVYEQANELENEEMVVFWAARLGLTITYKEQEETEHGLDFVPEEDSEEEEEEMTGQGQTSEGSGI